MPTKQIAKPEAHSREFVQALERGFAIVRAFNQQEPAQTMAQVALNTGVPRAVARRYLFTLQALGYVEQRDSKYSLTPRILDLGFSYLASLNLPALAQSLMESLVDDLHESCSLSILDGRDVVYIARVPAKRIMSINLGVGSRLPAHATSMGKVLLASLPTAELDRFFSLGALERLTSHTVVNPTALRKSLKVVHDQGWALAEQESEDNVRSIAAPILDRRGATRAALNLSAHVSRVSLKQLTGDFLPKVLDTARAISRALRAIE